MKRMKLIFLLLLAIGTTIFLGACNEETAQNDAGEEIDIEQIVYNYSTKDFDDISASITSDELIVKDGDGEATVYDLPEDKFFVSIAPFINETHPCEIHSLTGCQGELTEEDFDVEIRDSEGNVVVDKSLKTMKNGFIDLWLPRDENFSVVISHDGKTAESELSTYSGDNTCITTMQLKDI